MTRGQRLVALWLRQRKLKMQLRRGRDRIPFYRTPNGDDYAELARRIDSFARRVKSGRGLR